MNVDDFLWIFLIVIGILFAAVFVLASSSFILIGSGVILYLCTSEIISDCLRKAHRKEEKDLNDRFHQLEKKAEEELAKFIKTKETKETNVIDGILTI